MSAIVDLVLGIVTSIGGFVEVGSISTAAQAGSEFGFQLLWAIAAATVMLALLVEMSGRLAAVSRRSLDRKSTRLNSSHLVISYAVFCLKKKKRYIRNHDMHDL